jgi:hypothetical protein
MSTVTVQSLIDRAVAASDMKDNFVRNSQWLAWANQAYKELSVMVAQMGVPYFQYDETITATGASEYAIEEPVAIVAVYRLTPTGKLHKLLPNDSIQMQLSTLTTGEPSRYAVKRVDNTVVLQFVPSPSSGSIVVRAIRHPLVLVLEDPGVGETTSISLPLGWEEYIVLKMARNALAKEETVHPLIETQLREIIEHVNVSGRNYIMTDIQKIRDVRSDNWISDEWVWV